MNQITYRPEEKVPVLEYVKTQRRFAHLSSKEVATFQELVDRNWRRLEVLETLKF